MTYDELCALVRFLVSNTFLANGDTVYRQTVGIPMGTNCAPVLANLYLYRYEAAYFSRVYNEEGRAAAAEFRASFLLIDDVLSVDNPRWRDGISRSFENGGLYPAALQLNETTVSPTSADFIGMHIEL